MYELRTVKQTKMSACVLIDYCELNFIKIGTNFVRVYIYMCDILIKTCVKKIYEVRTS